MPSAAAKGGSATVAGYGERTEPLRLVTLGDAYTRGTETAAPRRDSWPAQLVESLERSDVDLWLWNLAESGHSSDQLLEEQLGQVASLQPDVVTLQVGVNDILAKSTDIYRENVTHILDELLTILPKERIFAITTPDHTLTEWGDAYGPRAYGSAAVAKLNLTLTEVAEARGITVIDIGQVNERVSGDQSLVVDEGPYPTAKQYAGWVEVIGPYIRGALATIEP